jgi:16S rRNA (cytosine967-C5)-methyltransferase
LSRDAHAGLPPARKLALAVLGRVLPEPTRRKGPGAGQDVQAALDAALLSAADGDPRDRGLATELVYGYLRLRGRLAHICARFLKNPDAVPVPVRRILELAAYEILFCSKVPAYASVDWAVSAVRAKAGKGLSGMANAVLRRIAADPAVFEEADFYCADRCSETEYLSRYYSCPEWIVTLWLRDFGPEQTREYLTAQLASAPLGLRINRAREGARELFDALAAAPDALTAAYPTLAVPAGAELFGAADCDLTSALAQGRLSRQSAAAQRILYDLGLEDWPEPVYDACAGRGGKTLLLAEAGKKVIAGDMHAGRLAGLGREAVRLGLPPVATLRASATRLPLVPGKAGTILLDAPCSGLGVLSRRPDAKWRRRPEDVAGLVRLQRAMLEAAYAALPVGGCIVYVTCTAHQAENEGNIDRLGARHRDLVLEAEVPAAPSPELGETFYGAVLKKK